MTSWIERADIYSIKPYFYLENHKKQSQSMFGGIISIASVLLTSSCVLYFLTIFLTRQSYKIVSNQEINDEISLANINEYPFMFRVTDNNALVPSNSTSLVKIKMAFCSSEFNEVTGLKQHLHYYVKMEKCSISKHFGSYSYLFDNMTDLSTFDCPDWSTVDAKFKGKINLNRVYGSPKEYTFLHLFVSACDNKTDFPVICTDQSRIDSLLTSPFFEYRYIDNKINSNSMTPNIPFVAGERESFSPTMFKRIWLYWKHNTYISDFGFIFQEMVTSSFTQTDFIKIDIDLRDWRTQSLQPGSFLWFTLSNSKNQFKYSREFLKSQDFLASVGGIIKGITVIGYVLNWMCSTKFYYESLISFLGIERIVNRKMDHSFSETKSISSIGKINNFTLPANKTLKKHEDKSGHLAFDVDFKNEKNRLTWKEKILPFCLTKSSHRKRIYELGVEQVNELISLQNFIRITNEVEGLKEVLLDSSQVQLFEHIFSNNHHNKDNLGDKKIDLMNIANVKDKITERLKSFIK